MLLQSAFVLLSSLALVASGYNCNGTTTIDAPSDLSKIVYFPEGWTESQDIPKVDPNMWCTVNLNIPQGVYANVTFYKHFESREVAYILYPSKYLKMLANDDQTPYMFTAPLASINIANMLNGSAIAFKIQYMKYPKMEKNVINIYKGKAPVVVNANNKLTTFIGGPNSMISLAAFSLQNPSMNYILRQSAIFSGDSVNGQFIGTLEQVLTRKYQLTSYRNKMSVYTFGLSETIDYPLFLAQDWEDSEPIFYYQGDNCPSTGDCKVNITGLGPDTYAVTYFDGPEIIKDFNNFADGMIFSAYENTVSNTTLVATLTIDDYKQKLPIQVNGVMKYYVLHGVGTTEMVLTRDTSRPSRH